MKKLILFNLILSFFLAFISCSSDDDAISIENSENDLKLLLNLKKTSTGSNLLNLQVGDTLTFKYTITSNFESDNPYEISPISTITEKHQVINKDYEIFFNDIKVNKIVTNNKEGEFKYLIKRAGNFDNIFILSAENKANKIYKDEYNLFFNAVKIVAYSYITKTKKGGTFNHSRWNYYNKIYVETGFEKNDNFLNNSKYDIKFLHLSSTFENFQKNLSSDFYPVQNYEGGSNPSIKPTLINSIAFTKEVGNDKIKITYDNIPVTYFGRQDSWGNDGKNNF